MNLPILLICLTGLSVLDTYAWQVPSLLRQYSLQKLNPFLTKNTNGLPQFLLESHKPFLQEIPPWLTSTSLSKDDVCSMDNDALVARNLPVSQADLFKHIEINSNRGDLSKDLPPWAKAEAILKDIISCPAALQHAQSVNIDLYVSVDEPKPLGLQDLFFQALSSMPQLQKLTWNTHGVGDELFRTAFEDAGSHLSKIKHLGTYLTSHWLIAVCPNIETLHQLGTPWPETSHFVNATKFAKSLDHLQMSSLWKVEHIQHLFAASPQLSTITIDGKIGKDTYSYDTTKLQTISHALTVFRELKHLNLPHARSLALGFDGGPFCGNAYNGAAGKLLRREISRQKLEATEKAAKIVLEILPNLWTLSIGGTQAKLVRNADGSMEAEWPWTDRVEDWLYEQCPITEEEQKMEQDEKQTWPSKFVWGMEDILEDGLENWQDMLHHIIPEHIMPDEGEWDPVRRTFHPKNTIPATTGHGW